MYELSVGSPQSILICSTDGLCLVWVQRPAAVPSEWDAARLLSPGPLLPHDFTTPMSGGAALLQQESGLTGAHLNAHMNNAALCLTTVIS